MVVGMVFVLHVGALFVSGDLADAAHLARCLRGWYPPLLGEHTFDARQVSDEPKNLKRNNL